MVAVGYNPFVNGTGAERLTYITDTGDDPPYLASFVGAATTHWLSMSHDPNMDGDSTIYIAFARGEGALPGNIFTYTDDNNEDTGFGARITAAGDLEVWANDSSDPLFVIDAGALVVNEVNVVGIVIDDSSSQLRVQLGPAGALTAVDVPFVASTNGYLIPAIPEAGGGPAEGTAPARMYGVWAFNEAHGDDVVPEIIKFLAKKYN